MCIVHVYPDDKNHRHGHQLLGTHVGDSFHTRVFPRLPFFSSVGRPSPSPKSFIRCASAISAFISMHLLLREEQTAAYTVEIWKRFRKWGGIPTGITQNVKDLLSSREVENIFENSDFILMLNQASGDRQILAKQLNISPHQLSYVTHSGEGEGLLFYGNVILPFVDRFPRGELYDLLTTKPQEQTA